MSDMPSVTYDGVVISYNENKDRWEFELRGRERSAESLAKAKEAIDKPEPKEKSFKRVQAYLGTDFEAVEVTSVAEGNHWSSNQYFWVTSSRGRRKEARSRLFPINPHNDALKEQIKKIKADIQTLEDKLGVLRSQLETIEVEK